MMAQTDREFKNKIIELEAKIGRRDLTIEILKGEIRRMRANKEKSRKFRARNKNTP